MILTGRPDRVLEHKGEMIVSFVVDSYLAREFGKLEDKLYKIEITEVKSKKSLMQLRYLWKLIHEIAHAEGSDEIEVYCNIIKMAKIKTVFIETVPQAKQDLEKAFRAVIERDVRTSQKGVTTSVFECYYGVSTFDVPEMSEFIDRMLDYATQVGVDLTEYGDTWRKE